MFNFHLGIFMCVLYSQCFDALTKTNNFCFYFHRDFESIYAQGIYYTHMIREIFLLRFSFI